MWARFPDKTKWIQLAESDKERYAKEKAALISNHHMVGKKV
jgi:hypothetical protein